MARWLDLPKLIWELIYEKLDLVDRHRFSGTCSSFQSLAIKNQRCRLSAPVLVILPGKENSKSCEFYGLSDGKTCEINLPELHGKWCLGSSYGWLFTVDFIAGEISLFNPLSRVQIQLPPLSTFTDPPGLRKEQRERNIQYIERATVSKSPSTSNDFVVTAIYTDLRVFAFCKPGDKKRTTLTRPGDQCEDVIYHKQKFYAITNWGALKRWDRCHVNDPVETVIPAPKYEECLRRYLAETPNGELLKVCRYTEWEEDDYDGDDGHSHTLSFEVYKLDKLGKKERWVAVESLGDKALFVGYNRAICVSVDLKCPWLKANSIYFTDDYFEGYYESPYGCYDNGVFSLEDERINQFYKNPPIWSAPCIWISPTPR